MPQARPIRRRPKTSPLPTDPHSGRTFWWSDRGDGMDATLTKAIDLRSATDPKLGFWTWYGIEVDYDYAYVTVSTDGGAHWTPLKTEASSATDPNGLWILRCARLG